MRNTAESYDTRKSQTYGVHYRFGFNGQERDDEIAGVGNINTAEFWEYDARLCRRWNLDPKPQINMSDYCVMGGNPILFLDRLGDEKQSRHLDPKGNVIAEYDDGDNSVYKHQTAKTKSEVDYWRAKFNNNSGNGVNMGQMSNVGVGLYNIGKINIEQNKNWITNQLNTTQNSIDFKGEKTPKGGIINSYGLNVAGGGGFNVSLGTVEDSKGKMALFFSIGPSVGITAGFSAQTIVVKPTNGLDFNVKDVSGWGKTQSVSFALYTVTEGGNFTLGEYKSTYKSTYKEKGTGASFGMPGYSIDFNYTGLLLFE